MEKTFDINAFVNPESKYYPVYSWVWNDIIDKDEIRRQIDEMWDRNIRGTYIIPLAAEFRPDTMITNLQPPYLSDGYFDMVKTAVDYAAEKGMQFWIYDESGWPSGGANFEVMKSDDAFALELIEDDGNLTINRKLPDITNIDATRKFIELTHEQYKEKLGESFKKLSPYVFTDEPFIRSMPFTKTLRKEFLKRTGEELDFDKVKNRDDVKFNLKYHDVCSKVFAENYFEPVKKWCNDNGMMLTGHLNGEHETLGFSYYGHHYAMRLLRLMDVPGIDVIWGQIAPDKECLFFPRLASSAAEQSGCGLSVSESFSVYGALTYEQMRYCVGYQIVRGINIINPMLLMYDDSKYYSLRQRPSFSSKLPGAEYLSEFNRYTASLQYIMQNGAPCTDCALYMPVRDFWANDSETEIAAKAYDSLGTAIERHHGQFDIIDDDLIENCDSEALKNGIIKMGRAEYGTVYIPADKYMTDAARKRLSEFEACGGKIYYSHNAEFEPVMDVSGDDGWLRVHKRKYDNCEVYVVFNESGRETNASVNLPEGSFELSVSDLNTYEICDSYLMQSGEIRVFVSGINCDTKPSKAIESGETLCTLGDFEMKPLRRFSVDEESAKYSDVFEDSVKTNPGVWNRVLGDDFSGECEYRTEFELESESALSDIIVDLGDVKYSCSVSVNGVCIGDRMMPPYTLNVPGHILKEKNELVVKVSNTASNAFVSFVIPEHWEQKHVGPYHKICLEQEKELLESGLIGPVTIKARV